MRLTRSQRLQRQFGGMPVLLAPERRLPDWFQKRIRRAYGRQPGRRYDDGDLCCWCSEVRSKEERGHEHVIPRSKGGMDGWANTVPACHGCNNPRGSYSVPLWLLALRQAGGDARAAAAWIGATVYRCEREAAALRKTAAAAAKNRVLIIDSERGRIARLRRASRALALVLAAQAAGELNPPAVRRRW